MYTLPFDASSQIHRLIVLLEEKLGDKVILAVEMASLETAYIRIVEQFQDEKTEELKVDRLGEPVAVEEIIVGAGVEAA